MDCFNAFWVGGLICALVQILLDKTKLLPGRVMVILVCSGVVLSAIGLYQPLTDYAGAGATVPLTGFRPGIMEGHEKKPLTRTDFSVFTGGFTACSAGVSAALLFPGSEVLFSVRK